jgi:hypothetical protein
MLIKKLNIFRIMAPYSILSGTEKGKGIFPCGVKMDQAVRDVDNLTDICQQTFYKM